MGRAETVHSGHENMMACNHVGYWHKVGFVLRPLVAEQVDSRKNSFRHIMHCEEFALW